MKHRLAHLLAVAVLCSAGPVLAQATFKDGDSVEAREGDTWSPATVVHKEGRRYQIRYTGSSDQEWVTADRLRAVVGGAGIAVPKAPVASDTPDTTAAVGNEASDDPAFAPQKLWKPDQEVDVKRGAAWRRAKVTKFDNGWVLVTYTTAAFKEWVEPWRIREAGSKDDGLPNAPMNKEAKDGDGPPANPPSARPDSAATAGFPNWREPAVGDRVAVFEFGNEYKTAKVLDKRDDELRVALEDSREVKWIKAIDARVAGLKLDPKVGQRVLIREGGKWQAGTIASRDGDRVKVMLDGWENPMFHKPRLVDELRPPGPDDVPPAKGASADQLRKVPGFRDADTRSARQMVLIAGPGKQITIEPATQPAAPPTVQTARVPSSAGKPTPKAVIGARAKPNIVVVDCQSDDAEQHLVDRLDLASGEPLNSVKIPVKREEQLLDVSPDGTLVVFGRPHWGDRVEVWSIEQPTARRELLMFPYAGDDEHRKEVVSAVFVRNDRLLTTGGKNALYIFDTKTGRALLFSECSLASTPAVSPDGKYVAFNTGSQPALVDVTTGKAVLDVPEAMSSAMHFAFTPSGKYLFAADSSTVFVVDLSTGELTREFSLPGNTQITTLSAAGDGYALANNSVLIDIEKRYPIWKYDLGMFSAAATLSQGQLAFATDTDSRAAGSLVAVPVPHAAARKAAAALTAPEFILRPGAAVCLAVNVQQDREKILAHATAQLKAAGIQINDRAPVHLTYSLEMGKTSTHEYHSGPSFGPFAKPPDIVTVTEKISRIRIEFGGATVWEVSAQSNGPGFMLMRQGNQTLQQAADAVSGPNTEIFYNTHLPVYLVMPQNPLYLGASDLTGRGLKDKAAEPDIKNPAPGNAPPKPGIRSLRGQNEA